MRLMMDAKLGRSDFLGTSRRRRTNDGTEAFSFTPLTKNSAEKLILG
jgi:hypothetical protein